MVQRVEAWGNVLEFPADMSDADIAAAIQKNEAHLNPDASLMVKGKSAVSSAIDAGLSMFAPKKSIAEQAEERSAETAGLAAPQVKGAPVRRDFYNRMASETPQGSSEPDTGIVARTRNAAANDTKAQGNKQAVAGALANTEPEEEGGFVASAARAAGAGIKGAGQVAADFIPGVDQDNALKRAGQGIIDANPTAVNSLDDIADKPGTAVAEASGNAASSMAGIVGARAVGQGITALSPLAGPAAPLVAAAGQVVSWLGPAAIAALPSFGGIRDKQILSDPNNQDSAKAKAVAALGAATVGAIESRFGPQNWALAAMTKEGRAKLAEKFAATTLKGSIGKGIGKGMMAEGTEELVQNPVEQLAAFDNPTTPENIDETLFGGAMGAIGGGVMGGGTGAVFRGNPAQEDADHTATILGKPITEVSNSVLKYTAARGGERAKAAAQAELSRRATEGIDPEIANAPESTSEAVDRIISTGKDKADEIRQSQQAAPDAIQDDVFDEEPDHVPDVGNMVDAPTPERIETLNAQMDALAEGRKPGVLLTPGEPMPDTLPEGVQAAEIPGRGTLLYRDDATLQAALDNRMGEALGYGIDEKPETDQVVTARDANGTVIQDVATDGRPGVERAAAAVAGENGTVEVRPVAEAMAERAANSPEFEGVKTQADVVIPTSNIDQSVTNGTTNPISQSGPARETRPAPKPSIESKSREAKSPAGNESVAEGKQAVQPAKKTPKPKKSSLRAELEEHFRPGSIIRSNYWGTYDRVESFDWNDGNWSVTVRKVAKDKDGGWANVERSRVHNTLPNKKDSVVERASAGTQAAHPVRSHVESLIKRRAAARQGGKDLSKAIERAKEVMEGKRTDAKVEGRYFSLQAKAFEKADAEAAKILRQIAEAVKAKESTTDAPKFSRAPQPADFVETPDGGIDFGHINKEVGSKIKRQAAPIRLAHGVHKPDGSGHGLVHIEANHGKQIRNAGFESVESFVAHVAKNFNEILHASGRQLLVAVENGRKDVMFVQLEPSENGDYYRINTAFPTSRDYLEKQLQKGMKVLWSGSEPTLAVTGKQPAYAANPEASSSQDDPIARGQSNSNIADEGIKFNRERIAETRKRLKAASTKSKQATHRGGLSVSGVEKLIEPLQQAGFKKINIAATQSDLPKAVKEQIKSQNAGGVRGVYIPAPDEIWLVADQLNDAFEVFLVTMHEARHRGFRKMFGPGIDPIMRQIYATNKRVRDAADRMMRLHKDMSKETAVEEVLADMSIDRAKALNGWKKLVRFIKQWIAERFNLTFTDEMVEQLVAGAEVVGMAENEVSLFDDKQAEAYREASSGTMFSRKPSRPDNNASSGPSRTSRIVDSLIFNFQDRFMDLRDIQKEAGPVNEDMDASLAEINYPGRVRARTDDFHDDMRDPLIQAIHDGNLKYEEVEEFLHAMHAPSRNAAMKDINPTVQELDERIKKLAATRDRLAKDKNVVEFIQKRRELRQAQSDVEDGLVDPTDEILLDREVSELRKKKAVQDYVQSIEQLKRLQNMKPFDGDNTALSGMSDAAAKAVIQKVKETGKLEALQRASSMVDEITTATRKVIVDAGLETPEMIAAWEAKYDHYVPLHRDEVGGNTNPPVGRGFNIRGKESKRATGSNRAVTDILAHVVAQHETAIIRAEKSRVDNALFEFVMAHPDPELWKVDDQDTKREMDPVTGLVVERVDPLYKQRDEVLTFKIDGEEHTIEFNKQNPAAMRLASSIKNLSTQQLGEVTQAVGKFTRFLATMNTTANPVFVARNFLRDLQTAYVNLSDTELAGMKRQVFADVPKAIRGMWQLTRGNMNSQWAKDAREFRDSGGQVGWMDNYRDIGERADKLRNQLEVMGPGKWNFTRRLAKDWWELIEDANSAVENGIRLAVYVNARKRGLSEGKSSSVAKGLTVNFNLKGAKSTELNMWYMFMNASIQGTARLIQALGNKQVQKIVGGIVASGFLMDILARSMAGDDDDDGENDYDQLPEHTKAMNFVFMAGSRPVTVPMPYGYNFFASVGRKMSEGMFRENYSPANSAVELAAVFFDAFSPVGQAGSVTQLIAPTIGDPLVQWGENKNFAGNPMRREQSPFGVPKPEYQMGFKSTSAPAKWLTEFLNDATGGNEVRPGFIDTNPALLDFAVSSLAGGAGRTYLQAFSLPIKAAQDEEIQAKEVPFANIFLSAKPEYQTERKFYQNLKSVNLAEEELKNFRGDPEKRAALRDEYGELKLSGRAKFVSNILENMRKRERAIEKSNPDDKREKLKELAERKRVLMSDFNKRYVEATR
ncbi:LPD38 domain-containing protein [Nitrosovibrio sp. Nv4]|uniref:LPD38 domain-containing protein n=1 Tax=Nitrosovibrio sp. Nv4 TaxID=1945880 RepID=UPI000BC6A490|nr:LPD38 domain-containing protein [Nitrosovibrio sp. Nv4]SOD42346.1 hypothetical protein SAMN06298226_2685 [Nitrosovibrio sp. Nv4]